MKDVFKKIRVECYECGQPLNGDNLRKRGDRYYCATDYEKTSPNELQQNKFQEIRKRNYDKIFKH
jgi:ribosomal protein L33